MNGCRRRGFTLFEILIAMALLVVLAVIMLKIFVGTSDLWSASDEQSRMYGDAKVALSLISEDLENIIYQRDNSDGTKVIVAPIWLQADGVNRMLHFFSRPRAATNAVDAADTSTRAAKVSWGFDTATHALYRRAYFEKTSPGFDMLTYDKTNAGTIFANVAVANIFTPDFLVIDGVYSVAFNAFAVNDTTAKGATTAASTGLTGVHSIQIVITMMTPRRQTELAGIADSGDRNEFIRQHSRTFSKLITLEVAQ